jgi:NADPH:quinone reductase-like Zn-dependent oxidoreductase
VLGWDGAGIVASTGPAVTRFRPGDEVYFCDGGFGPVPGTYQEVRVVDERLAAPLVTITAWEATRDRARVDKDQHVLVQAGAGGVRHEDVAAKVREWSGMDGADVVHDTVGGRTFTACFSLVRPYGDLVSNVESPWEDEAIAAMHGRRTGSGSGGYSSRRRLTSTRASCASWSARRSRWNAPPTPIAPWKPGRSPARPSSPWVPEQGLSP